MRTRRRAAHRAVGDTDGGVEGPEGRRAEAAAAASAQQQPVGRAGPDGSGDAGGAPHQRLGGERRLRGLDNGRRQYDEQRADEQREQGLRLVECRQWLDRAVEGGDGCSSGGGVTSGAAAGVSCSCPSSGYAGHRQNIPQPTCVRKIEALDTGAKVSDRTLKHWPGSVRRGVTETCVGCGGAHLWTCRGRRR